MVIGDSPAHNTLTGETIYLEVTIGSYVCKSATPTCLIGSDMPPVEIQVDYGDGSGISTWTRENAQDLWRHSYSQAGTFTVTTVVTGVYDKVVQTKTVFITVTETVTGHFS